jgi:hypothetical protein
MFGNWLNGVEKHTKAQICLGVCALLWVLWNCRNDMVFNKIGTAHFLQVIRMATHWTGVVLSSSGGAAGAYGFWMHPSGDGCSGYLQPGWLAAF